MAGEREKPSGKNNAGEPRSPRNLFRESWRREPEDPPNLHRLTTRQTIEQQGVVEVYERFIGVGDDTAIQIPEPEPRGHRSTLKRDPGVKK
jgi:hypothetical protein